MRIHRACSVPIASLALFPILALAPFLACDDTGGSAVDPGVTTDVPPAAITISGTLVAGSQGQSPAPRLLPGVRASALETGDPLAGYRLYCVTFATPPDAATGTADAAGQVSLQIDALGVAFGCFVLDADGNGVATMLFRAGTEVGQTVTLTGDADLGTITVDLGNGVAVTTAGDDIDLSGSDDLPCPLGTWAVDVPRDDCDGMASATAWFVADEAGAIRASFTIGPVQLAGTDGVCGWHSDADLPVTWADGKWTFQFVHDPSCPSRMMTLVGTPNANCTEVAVESAFGPCLACQDGACGCDEGTLTCTRNLTLERR
jgi:hypothetical protein